ncbi:malonyl-coenzyme A:anthocyanin 3-O-glucoside-6''-O-malonyltransferase-like [Apium graveolens]|uniref:malonyl-coenzyme A:anthocyanin 3-O-glucoside-6''-O-malonyltransferase-like n=1 Tax=Apium graveolens TaxID=4045 RepID=UPI003D7A0E45
MASNSHTITVIEHCRISPPPDTVAENSIPLTFFDLLWLNLSPFSRVLFYDFNGTRTDFAQDLVPKLKTSLSLALQHYFPFAGNLVTPTTYNDGICISTKTTIRYLDGDSVSLTVAECDADFIRLTGNQSRDIDELSCLAPQLSPGFQEHSLNGGCEVQVSSVLAIQVTYFPGQGICIGFTNSHAVADGRTIFNFIRAWGLIAKSSPLNLSDDASLYNCSKLFKLPFYDRSVIKDPEGNLAAIYMSQKEKSYSHVPPILAPAPAKKVRATLVLAQTNIEALKKLVSTKLPRLPHISSLTVTCGYIWSCLAKVRNAIDSTVEDEEQHLMLAVDCRARLDPPVPETYFGNCITSCLITTKNSQLVRERGEGFIRATELIGESIYKKLNGGILVGAEMWYEDFKVVKTKWKRERVLGIAGSPNFYFYDTDFGWGRPRKYEFISQKLSITRCRDVIADIEVGLCLTEDEMVSFSSIFWEGLLKLS